MPALVGNQFYGVQPGCLPDRPEIEGEIPIWRWRNVLKYADIRGIGRSGVRENVEKAQQRTAVHVHIEDALVVCAFA